MSVDYAEAVQIRRRGYSFRALVMAAMMDEAMDDDSYRALRRAFPTIANEYDAAIQPDVEAMNKEQAALEAVGQAVFVAIHEPVDETVFGPQPAPDDPRIYRGSVAGFFDEAAGNVVEGQEEKR